ncbi:basic region leucine zipper [Diplocarpon rosae]|nr:basic region leucine zipper [Diplocarpon rosae]
MLPIQSRELIPHHPERDAHTIPGTMSAGAPHIKFEHSPADSLADSLISTPTTPYPSLFHHQSETMDPTEVMTPRSYEDDSMFGGSLNGSLAGTPAPEKKQVKKRKSWGQQLPEPKTNLPPRKRAKTEDEKEQRRVERVLRNRRAAQSSRERKRQEVEALEAQKLIVEQTNQDLLRRLQEAEAKNLVLQRQLEELGGGMKAFPSSSAASSPRGAEQIRLSPRPSLITFSQTLFGPSEAEPHLTSTPPDADPSMVQTVNPASLSPEMGPTEPSSNAASSDLTQHPAAVFLDLSDLSHHPDDQHGYEGYLDYPTTTPTDTEFLDNRVLPLTDQFNNFLDNLDHHTALAFDDYQFDEFLINDDQPAPEIQSADPLAEKTASLQPPLGASPTGCDGGHVAPRDCLSAADASRRGTRNTPGLATLMTLLWTTKRIERERISTLQPDAAAAARQVGVASGSHGKARPRKHKSLDPWRTAFYRDRL